MRFRLVTGLLIAAAAAGAQDADAERAKQTTLVALIARAEGAHVFDHRRLADALDDDAIAAAREQALLIGLSQDGSELRQGLLALAEEEPERFALRSAVSPGANFYRSGGIGFFLTGRSGHPESRCESFLRRIDMGELGAELDAALLDFSPSDISHGRRIETTVTSYRVTTGIRHYSVVLGDSFTENITAQRMFGRGPGSGGALSTGGFPLDLPSAGARGVDTTGGIDGGGEQEAVERRFASRYPPVAFNMYQQTMDVLVKAYPETTFIWTTVPLRHDGNLQRNIFNAMVRAHCQEHGHWLYDLAAIAGHDDAGEAAADGHGQIIAAAWRGERDGELDRAGRLRLARVWWRLIADIAAARR